MDQRIIDGAQILPHFLEAEVSVLGAILNRPPALSEVKGTLKPDDFYHNGHRVIYRAMLNLSKNGNPVDTVSVIEELKKSENLEKAGGSLSILSLPEQVPTTHLIKHHAKLIREYAIKRRLIRLAQQVENEKNGGCDVGNLLSTYRKGISELIEELTDHETVSFGVSKVHIKTVAAYGADYRKNYGNVERRVNLGIPEIDRHIRFIAPGQVMAILGSTGCGKTIFIQNRVQHFVKYSGEFGVLFELEQPGAEIFERAAQFVNEDWGGNIESRFFDDGEDQEIIRKVKEEYPSFLVVDRPGLSWEDVIEYCRIIEGDIIEKKLGLVAVDYLGLMSVDGAGGLYEATTKLAHGMKQTARELDVPLLVTVQVTGTKSSTDPITLGSIRDSKSIGHAADYVIALTREPDDMGEPSNNLIVKLLKNRRGGTCTAKMAFNPKSLKLEHI